MEYLRKILHFKREELGEEFARTRPDKRLKSDCVNSPGIAPGS